MLSKLAVLLCVGLALTAGYFWVSQPKATAVAQNHACSPATGDAQHPGMRWVPGGSFTMGAEIAYREEGPAYPESVNGFWMDTTEVTNAQFGEFVAATGYVTLAERGIFNPADPDAAPIPGSAVFNPDNYDGSDPFSTWWQFVVDAQWRHPEGPASNLDGLQQHPVVHIAYEDALAYAQWKGHKLPTEEQFEYAAKSSSRKNPAGEYVSNTWEGIFPFQNSPDDGYLGTAPVGCYTANEFGLYDLIGNVWEWTSSPYYMGHDFADKAAYPTGYDPMQPEEKEVAVIKGGSYLCAPNYCMRYRPEARQGQTKGLGTSHIGFRTVLMAAPPTQ